MLTPVNSQLREGLGARDAFTLPSFGVIEGEAKGDVPA